MADLTGQIGIVPHARTFNEWLIQTVTRSPVHHAILAVSSTECVSCEPGGALLRDISRFPDAYWSGFALTPEQTARIVTFGRTNIGKPYGWFADFFIGIALLSGIHTPKWIERRLNDGKRFECAQFCDAAYTFAGIHLFAGIVPAAVFPGMFVPIWRSNGWMD